MKIPEEIQKAFLDKGVKISIEELEEIAKNVSQIINNPHAKKEIIDNEMESSISGGLNIHKGLRTAAAIIAGVGVGGSAAYVAYKAGTVLDNANATLAKANDAADGVTNGYLGRLLRWGS